MLCNLLKKKQDLFKMYLNKKRRQWSLSQKFIYLINYIELHTIKENLYYKSESEINILFNYKNRYTPFNYTFNILLKMIIEVNEFLNLQVYLRYRSQYLVLCAVRSNLYLLFCSNIVAIKANQINNTYLEGLFKQLNFFVFECFNFYKLGLEQINLLSSIKYNNILILINFYILICLESSSHLYKYFIFNFFFKDYSCLLNFSFRSTDFVTKVIYIDRIAVLADSISADTFKIKLDAFYKASEFNFLFSDILKRKDDDLVDDDLYIQIT